MTKISTVSAEPNRQNGHLPIPAEATLQRIRFAPRVAGGPEALLDFPDPTPQQAICETIETKSVENGAAEISSVDDDGLEILTIPGQPQQQLEWNDECLNWAAAAHAPRGAAPIAITLQGAHIIWTTSRAAVMAAPDRVASFQLALVDFSYYERELRKLEREIAECWPVLEHDAPLAHTVPAHEPERFEDIGRRMEQTFARRMRLARIEPHLCQPRAQYLPLANQLLDRLREKSHIEGRLEALDAQLEVYERIYELNGQRISEFRAARQGHNLEWIIIILLATESLLLAIDVLWTQGL